VTLAPKPIQARVPIDIAVNPAPDARPEIVERALRRVARLADGWQTDGTPPEVFRQRWAHVRQYAREYGRADQLRTSSLHLMVNINDSPETAWDEAFDFLDRYYGFGPKELLSPERKAKLSAWIANGSPEQVAAKIQSFIDAGCTTPILRAGPASAASALHRRGLAARQTPESLTLSPPAGRLTRADRGSGASAPLPQSRQRRSARSRCRLARPRQRRRT
jgi:alkanesulfonate monooxygenase SsuD/methylene tetrahydromethanopterin reductase-like flavin-dependent oxidoreductase (luciferase family)